MFSIVTRNPELVNTGLTESSNSARGFPTSALRDKAIELCNIATSIVLSFTIINFEREGPYPCPRRSYRAAAFIVTALCSHNERRGSGCGKVWQNLRQILWSVAIIARISYVNIVILRRYKGSTSLLK